MAYIVVDGSSGGELLIYDYIAGISANNFTASDEFSGMIAIRDSGGTLFDPQAEEPPCAIRMGDTVLIKNGSFDLVSDYSNGINAANVNIKNCIELKVKGGVACDVYAVVASTSLSLDSKLEVIDALEKTVLTLKNKNDQYITIKEGSPQVYNGGGETYYDIKTTESTNGTFTVDKNSMYSGGTVTITVTPNLGYTLETLTVVDKNGKEIEVKDLGNDKYSFKMPARNVEVSATFMEDNTILNFCVDVKASDYFYKSVLWAYTNEICHGVDELHFNPNGKVTRAEAVTMLWRIAGEPYVNYAMQFKDVESSRYYTEAVRWAASEKIAVGYSETKFGTKDLLTREQLAVMIYNYAKKQGEGFTGAWMFLLPYNDRAKVSEWADEAAHWCSMKGVINGKDGNLFDPQGTATRAETVTMLQRFYDLGK
ncbi:MAG: S-layer homology domain-containing protein [Bacillota bacterium]|nr:S-layer homology domain-containing protein [Bacillota bacterium]